MRPKSLPSYSRTERDYPSLSFSRKRKHLLWLTSILLAVYLLSGGEIPPKSSSWSSWGAQIVYNKDRYQPGEIGERLLARHHQYLSPSKARSFVDQDMFDLRKGRDDSLCVDWNPDASSSSSSTGGPGSGAGGVESKCWKAKMLKQTEKLLSDLHPSMRQWDTHRKRNERALRRLSRCLRQSSSSSSSTSPLPTYPSDPDFLFRNASVFHDQDSDWIQDIECSETSFKVLLGSFWFFRMAFGGDTGRNGGEVIWMRDQLKGLYGKGYTVIDVEGQSGLIDVYRTIPDVVSMIWMEDKDHLSCQEDPRCIDYSTFTPTSERFNVDEEKKRGKANNEWLWTREELSRVPVGERGIIPLWKMFVTTFWGVAPHNHYWQTEDHELMWNPLGHEWTIAPYQYPDHSYIPFSVEASTESVPYIPPSQRQDRIFVLAKRTRYFEDSAIPDEFWATLKAQTGLTAFSVAMHEGLQEGEKEIFVPDGVETTGKHVSPEEFLELVGMSKAMVGIGNPVISPSIYASLVQGTPVVIPYFRGVAVPEGWKLFDETYSQHGPAAALGPPYVYSYDHKNTTMLVEMIKEAVANPIEKYIPPGMSHVEHMRSLDDLMRFDWKTHSELIRSSNQMSPPEWRQRSVSNCFEFGHCKVVQEGARWGS